MAAVAGDSRPLASVTDASLKAVMCGRRYSKHLLSTNSQSLPAGSATRSTLAL
jgi:hypothetical protein